MKKIIAIALAFVMVFAIAATALASVGINPVALPTNPNVKVTIEKFKLEKDTDGNAYWATFGASEGVKAGKTYGAKITVAFPANYKGSGETWLHVVVSNIAEYGTEAASLVPGTVQTSKVKVGSTTVDATVDGVGVLTGNFDTDTFKGDTANTYAEKYTKATTYTYFLAFNSIVDPDDDDDAKDALKITVDATFTDAAYNFGDDFAGWNGAQSALNIVVGGKDYYVVKDATEVPAQGTLATATTIASVTATGNYGIVNTKGTEGVFLQVGAEQRTDGYREVAGVYVYTDNTMYEAYALTVGGALAFRNGEKKIVAGDDDFADLKGILDKYLGLMGWSFSGSLGYVRDKDFLAKAGYTGAYTVTAVYAPYTMTLTVSGPAKVPDTGDNSVVGIVMIALAIVAGAAVALRKVRA